MSARTLLHGGAARRRRSMLLPSVLLVLAAACDGGTDAVTGVLPGPTESPPGASQPTLSRVELTPASVSVQAGATQQFQAVGRMSDGSASGVPVSWSATGGTVSAAGLYTAGSAAGTFRVIAASGSLADTSVVTVSVSAPATPPPPSGSYRTVIADDWQRYASRADLRKTGYFWWYLQGVDVHDYVDVVSDPTFGKVVRYTFQKSNDQGYAPKSHMDLPRPLDKMWLRWRMKYTPGWTTAGPLPAGYANSYKVAFWLWDGYDSRGQLEISNTDQYQPGLSVVDNGGNYLRYSESKLPGSQDFGRVTSEWSDGEWYEFVAYYEKTGATSARQHWWRRKLTQGGKIVDNPWVYTGVQLSGAPTPRVRAIRLGETKNKNNPQTQYIAWGPWEVVDGSQYPNPWNMPHVP